MVFAYKITYYTNNFYCIRDSYEDLQALKTDKKNSSHIIMWVCNTEQKDSYFEMDVVPQLAYTRKEVDTQVKDFCSFSELESPEIRTYQSFSTFNQLISK